MTLVIVTFSCNEPYHGSRIVGNIYTGGVIDQNTLVTPSRISAGDGTYTYPVTDDAGYIDHYELYAGIDGIGTVRLKNFLIRPVIENHHPCLQFVRDELRVDDGDGEEHFLNMCSYPFPDLNRDLYAVVSAAPSGIGTANPGYNFLEWAFDMRDPENTVLNPSCKTVGGELQDNRILYIKEAVNAYCSQLHKDYYIGNPYQLTAPVNGEFYGLVDNLDPRTGLATGGFSFPVRYKLQDITSIFVVADPDPDRLSTENFDENLPPNPEGRIILMGNSDGSFGYLDKDMFEGTWHGLMESPYGEQIWFEYTLFYDLDEDSVYF
ncbi:MAG: hypothetical protein JXR95_11045 [Deltaproteobacteria bacterium]|nr:hypothetical protein [Deltaproteobacteria bacterium]